MRRPPNLAVLFAPLAVLAAGNPAPRVVPVDDGTCRSLCLAAGEPCLAPAELPCPTPAAAPCVPCPAPGAATCAPCPDPGDNLPCRQAKGADCSRCILCLCGVGVLAPGVDLSPPGASETALAPSSRLLRPTAGDPDSPPPKLSA
jgi:hypothetical protein